MVSAAENFDVIVIGSGPGGYVCAIRAAQLGMKTACVELRATLGGTCLNVGCIPSKALLESTHHFHQAQKDFADHGIKITKLELDLAKMLERKSGVVKGITQGVEFLFKKNKVTWLKGWGKLAGPNSVSVSSEDGKQSTYSARNIVLATGSSPVELPFAKFDHKYIVDSTDALSFDKVPEHLIIVGAGVIGLEMGSVWHRLGAKVTFIEALDKILGNIDAEVSTSMLKLMQKQGMTFQLSASLQSVEIKNKKAYAQYTSKGETKTLEGDKVLIAVGRRAATANIGLESLGISTAKNGTISVNENFQTSQSGVYAIGDAIQGLMLAHKASEEGVAIAEKLAGKAGHVNYQAIPNIVYTWPEIASVGISEEDAKKTGLAYRVGKCTFKANARAKAVGMSEGFVKILADANTDRLLGVQIIGPMASEMIAEIAIAFEYGASAEDLARSVHAHPTFAELIKEAALDVDKRAIHA